MSAQAVPNDVSFQLSGGSGNTNPFRSVGGAISSSKIIQGKGFNNLWTDVTERQARYGYKDLRIIYIKNIHPTLTFKNARVFWNKSDNFTSLQIGRAGKNTTENSSLASAAVYPTALPIPPKQWASSALAYQQYRLIFDTLDPATSGGATGRQLGNSGGARARILAEKIVSAASPLNNQRIAKVKVRISRTGVSQGPVNCRIWNDNGEVRATIGSVDASFLVQEKVWYVFEFNNTSNTYQCAVGDYLGIEYPGAGQDEGEGSPDDYIAWTYHDLTANPDRDIPGTEGWAYVEGSWISVATSATGAPVEFQMRVEIYETVNCTPDLSDPDPTDGGGGQQFELLVDFNNLLATTAYQIGPNTISRQAVKINNSTAAILAAPIARMTFLARRVGNPQGDMACRIWDANGVVMETLGTSQVSNLTNSEFDWTQIAFTLETNAYRCKVGDLVGIEYTQGSATDHIALAGWTWQTAAAAAIESEAGQTAAATDVNGVRMMYANSGNFDYDWEIPGNSDSMRWDLTNPPLNAEMTGYFMKSSPSSDTISCKIRGGRHTDSAQNDGCCYIPQFPTTGGSMEFQIECPHPNNHDCSISGQSGSSTSLDQWHGYKVAWWNDSNNCVHIEAWNDTGNNSGSTPTNNWVKVFTHVDCDGNCGNIDTPLTRPKGSTSQCTFRIDNNSGTDGKWLSIVEIQPGGTAPPPPDGGGGPPPPPPGAKDVPGTSINRWNGAIWLINDGGLSDLVYRAEKMGVGTGPIEEPVIIDPGTKRKPTSFDQGIVLPPLGPGEYHGLIMERLFLPSTKSGVEEIEQQLVVEIDATTSPSQPTDPNNPPPTQPPPPTPPPPPPPTQPGEFPIPPGFVRVGNYDTNWDFWNRFETGYASGGSGPSLRWDNDFARLNMCAGYEFKIGPRHGVRGDDAIDIKFPRCEEPNGERGVYIPFLEWKVDGSNTTGGVGSEWPHPDTSHLDYNTDDPNPNIGNIKDGNWHGYLAACYNNSAGNVVIKQWYNPTASGNIADYIYVGSSIDVDGDIAPAPKLPYSAQNNSGGTHGLQIRIDEIPSNDEDGGDDKYPSANFELRKMFVCEIREGSASSSTFQSQHCPYGQHYDPVQNRCVEDAGSPATTTDGIVLPSLPEVTYTLDGAINYTVVADHRANGSFREVFENDSELHDLNNVIMGGYLKIDGTDDTEIVAQLGGGVHTTSDGGRSGRCYDIKIRLDGTKISIIKEDPHGTEHETHLSNVMNVGARQGHYTGLIFLKVNQNFQGEDCVRLKAWIETSAMSDAGVFTSAKQNWVLILDEIDTGDWHGSPWLTSAVPGNSIATIRTDSQVAETYDFKFGFCSRIKGPIGY